MKKRIMKTICFRASVCMLSIVLVLACACKSQNSSRSRSTKGVALGELTVDRCLSYIEGEDFSEKSGGDLDFKEAAFGKKCLGNRWGEKPTDYVTYNLSFESPVESALMVIRAAFDSQIPQTYQILLDDRVVQDAELIPTGGYGYFEKEWTCYSIPLGKIDKGPHTLTIQPSKRGGIINIDCLAVGKAG